MHTYYLQGREHVVIPLISVIPHAHKLGIFPDQTDLLPGVFVGLPLGEAWFDNIAYRPVLYRHV